MVLYASVLDGRPVNTGGPPPPDPDPNPGPPGGQDPNPIPAETAVRYASTTGTGVGMTPSDPMSITAGFAWIDDTANIGGATLRLLGGTYTRTTSLILDNPRDLGKNNYRVIRSHDLNNPAIIRTPQPNLQAAIDCYGGANRICFYGIEGDGTCRNTGLAGTYPADGTQYMFRWSEGGSTAAGKVCFGMWVKQCVMHNYYSGGIAALGYNAGIDSNACELFLVEDCEFYENCHGAPWGGSGCAINHLQQGVSDANVDDIFKVTIEGVQVTFGFIFRRNFGYRNYQAWEDSAGNAYTDGNFVTTDYWNAEDYSDSAAPAGSSDYNRGALLENNVSWGNGRFLAATYTHPSAGVWIRFNTTVWDGITYRHGEFGTSNEACHFGGYGGYNDVFRFHANLIIYDPNMNHPQGAAAMRISKDSARSGPQPRPLVCDWNLINKPSTVAMGEAFANATNTIAANPGLSTPPDYLAHNGRIARTTIKAWATPTSSSQARQPNQPYRPSDGCDAFWRPRTTGSIGACLPGGT